MFYLNFCSEHITSVDADIPQQGLIELQNFLQLKNNSFQSYETKLVCIFFYILHSFNGFTDTSSFSTSEKAGTY